MTCGFIVKAMGKKLGVDMMVYDLDRNAPRIPKML